jgi:hypothetical protein
MTAEDPDTTDSTPGVEAEDPPRTDPPDGDKPADGDDTADRGETHGEAVGVDTIHREDIPDDCVVLQSGYILDNSGILGRLHPDDRTVGGGEGSTE